MPNPLKEVKRLAKAGLVEFDGLAEQTARDDFGWGVDKVCLCISKLNGRLHRDNPRSNHYHKSDDHWGSTPGLTMDYYKAVQIMEGFSVYMHFHIENDCLVISSFKELRG